MRRKPSDLTVTDLFCGAGGSSLGAAQAGGRLRMALNHWDLAIETHNSNFPDASHDCTDVSACDPRRYPSTQILIASPECTSHSLAKGRKRKALGQSDLFTPGSQDPADIRSRATMWDVPRFAEAHRYELVIVENVVDARMWDPYPAWLQAMHCLGYEHLGAAGEPAEAGMSDGARIPWAEAFALAEEVAAELQPHCVRLKAVGSLRRRRPDVGDLEFIAEPRMVTVDLFGALAPDVAPIRRALESMGTWVQGAERAMRVTDLLDRPGLQLDLYLIHPPSDWNVQLAIRTGPAALGRAAVTRMWERGFFCDEGRLWTLAGRRPHETPAEADFFLAAGLPCVPPSARDALGEQLDQRVGAGGRR